MYQHMYTPPLIPPRGEVNAADAFDIGSFDEDDTKGVKVIPSDHSFDEGYQELYAHLMSVSLSVYDQLGNWCRSGVVRYLTSVSLFVCSVD